MRILVFFTVLIMSTLSYGQSNCYEGVSGLNGHKNITEICLLGAGKASMKVFYFNNLLKASPTTCSARANIEPIDNGFTFKAEVGECENGLKFGSNPMRCVNVLSESYKCTLVGYGVDFYFFKAQHIDE